MFKRGSIAWAIWNIVEAILLIVAGILCMAWSGEGDFQKNAVLVAGIVVIVDAGLRLLLSVIELFTASSVLMIKGNASQIIAGAAELALGISLCYIYGHYDGGNVGGTIIPPAKNVFGYVGIYMGVLMIVLAAVVIIHALVFFFRRYNSIGQNLFTLISGGVLLALGIVAILNLNPEKGENVVHFFLILFGLGALLLGILLGIGSVVTLIAAKKLKDDAEVNIVDETEEEAPSEEAPNLVEEKPEDK